jgi:N-acyl-D-amino-acid deacylase
MADAIETALDEGAVGVSTGLVYAPQRAASTPELLALGRATAPYGRPFVAHIRSEGRGIWSALDEFVRVGAETGVPLHVSHFKLVGDRQWGQTDRALARLATARERGVAITADLYPYTAGSTPLTGLLPPWLPSDDRDALLDALADPDVRADVADALAGVSDEWENVVGAVGAENVVIADVGSDADLPGKSLAEIAEARGTDPATVICDVLLEEDLEVTSIEHGMTEADVRALLAGEGVAIGTDGLYGAKPHPRLYGTYPRILGTFVREESVLSLPEAIHKMTALPASIYGLDRKGLLRPGMDADITVFDPDAVGSPATFTQPRQFPTGISHVLVNGTVAVEDGQLTGNRDGEILRS